MRGLELLTRELADRMVNHELLHDIRLHNLVSPWQVSHPLEPRDSILPQRTGSAPRCGPKLRTKTAGKAPDKETSLGNNACDLWALEGILPASYEIGYRGNGCDTLKIVRCES